ncbi:MAG: hypothetical protein Q4C73_06100 [Eubacteriales bacterium]|nr:hypothetical protein [Eubacteriales bacterium]
MTQRWKKQASAAYSYSLTKLALNSYIFAEELTGDWKELTEEQKESAETFLNILGQYLEGQDVLSQVEQLRGRMMAAMEAVVGYTDSFMVYEYALNRAERRFTDNLPPVSMTDEELTESLMDFIVESSSMDSGRRVQDVIGQLPVRFTRQKFYSIVKEAMGVFEGGGRDSLDHAVYLLLTSAMAHSAQKESSLYPELWSRLSELKSLSFKDMTKEGFLAAQELTELAGGQLSLLSDFYQMLQEMINDLYVLCLTGKDAVRNVSEEADAEGLLSAVRTFMESGEQEMPETMEERLYALEGLQERAMEKYARLNPAPEYAEGEDREAYLGRCVDRLLSGSLFVSLEDRKEELPVTKQDVEQAAGELIAAMDPVLKESQKPVARAVMASVLSRLPVYFHSLDEVRGYIAQSLAACTDAAEKEASKDVLKKIMEIEGYALV